MKKIFSRPKSLKKAVFHYCAGCGHSITHRLIAEVIDELNIQDRTIGIPPAGCAVIAYNYFDFDMLEAPHGRGCAVATGMKRVLPDRVIFSYQGDGDLAAIGTAETLHAANRGENITVIFINNAVYGMTGGQMAPTTLLGQVSTTTPPGRTALLDGHPIHLSEILGHLPGTSYIERCAVNTPVNIVKAKGNQEGLSKPAGRHWLLPRRDPLPVPDQLEDDPRGRLPVGEGSHGERVPAGSNQGHHNAGGG